jgi:hypothetical protein
MWFVGVFIVRLIRFLCRFLHIVSQGEPSARQRGFIVGDVLLVKRKRTHDCWPWWEDVIAVVLVVRSDDALILSWPASHIDSCGGDWTVQPWPKRVGQGCQLVAVSQKAVVHS